MRRAAPERRWLPHRIENVPDHLILFDGVCMFCSGWVRFAVARDVHHRFRFTPVQSAFGGHLSEQLGIDADNPETNAVIIRGIAYFKFDSVIEVLREFRGWRWIPLLRAIPRPLLNWFYDRIARNRYRWFGQMAICMTPEPSVAVRFLTDLPRTD